MVHKIRYTARPVSNRLRRQSNPLALSTIVLTLALTAGNASAATSDAISAVVINPQKIFVFLFLTLGPIKLLGPFVEMTRHLDSKARRQLTDRATLLSAAALLLAGALGDNMIKNFGIPLPVLQIAGGLILFLVALNAMLELYSQHTAPFQTTSLQPETNPREFHSAVARLAYPIIVTPSSVAAIIVFSALAKNDPNMLLTIAGITFLILVLDWLAMLFAEAILQWARLPLQLFGVILGIIQVSLGLQLMLRGLSLSGVSIVPLGQ